MLFLDTVTSFIQAALLGAFAFAAPDVAAPEPDDEAVEAGDEDVARRQLKCTISGDTETGRQWATVSTSLDPDVCVRWGRGGTAPVDYPSCHDRARNELGCDRVVTVPPPSA